MCFSRKFKDELILPDSDTLQWDKKKMCFFLLKLWRKFSMLDGYFRAWGGPLFVNVALTQWVSPDVIINPAIRPADFWHECIFQGVFCGLQPRFSWCDLCVYIYR